MPGDVLAQRDLRASGASTARRLRAQSAPVVAAGPAQHLVLRRLFRRRLPRGRAAGRARRRRGARRRAAALAGAGRIRPHRRGGRHRRRTRRRSPHDAALRPLCRIGHPPAAAPAQHRLRYRRVLAAARPRRARRAGPQAPAVLAQPLQPLQPSTTATTATAATAAARPDRAAAGGSRHRDRRRRDPPALHAAHPRLRLQSAQRLFLPRPDGALARASSTRSTTPSASATPTCIAGRRRCRRGDRPAAAPRRFYVSPFIGMDMRYAFRVDAAGRAASRSRSAARTPTDR